jgi:hypothetical protein
MTSQSLQSESNETRQHYSHRLDYFVFSKLSIMEACRIWKLIDRFIGMTLL